MTIVQVCVMVRAVDAGAAAPDGGSTPRQRPRMAMQRRLYGVGSRLCMVWVATWCCKGSEVVGPVGRGLRGWSGGKSGRRPRMFWHIVRGLRMVVSCSKGYRAPERCGAMARERAGDVGAAAPESGVCVCCNCGLVSCGRQGLVACAVFGSVFLINRLL